MTVAWLCNWCPRLLFCEFLTWKKGKCRLFRHCKCFWYIFSCLNLGSHPGSHDSLGTQPDSHMRESQWMQSTYKFFTIYDLKTRCIYIQLYDPRGLQFLGRRFPSCENIRFSLLFAAGDVSRGGTSATQRQKFHTDDVKYVQNPVRSPDWSTE